MLHYMIENGSMGSCCGNRLGADTESAQCPNPTLSYLKESPDAAKQVGQKSWCETRGGMYMCLPIDYCMAGWFKALQRAINAYAEKYPAVDKIRVDARIGPKTLAAVQHIAKINGVTPPASINELTMGYYSWLVEISDWAGVPINADPQPKPGPMESKTVMDPETAKKTGHDQRGWFGRNWGWLLLGAMGITAAGLGYNIYKNRKEENEGFSPIRARGI